MPDRPQKITFAEMRDMGVRGVLRTKSGARRLISQIAPGPLPSLGRSRQDESFQIRDAAGRILANVYFEDEPTRRNFSKHLSKDDARQMAQQILRLPELVRIAKGIDPSDA